MKEAIGFLKIEVFYFHINAAYARTWLSLFNGLAKLFHKVCKAATF